jgi:hypothetical protein
MMGSYAVSIFGKPIEMKILSLCSFLLISAAGMAQSENAENIFIITTDGFRWQEVFTGADSTLINDSRYVQDISLMKQLYWDSTAELRRQKLMPFFWSTISGQGQLYGNRAYQNKVDVSNIYKISYPGYNEMLTGYPDPVFIPNIPVRNRNTTILAYLNLKKEYAGKVAAFSSWNLFTAILNAKKNKFPVNSGYEQVPDDSSENNDMINLVQNQVAIKKNTRYDQLTFLSAQEYIEHNQPRVVMIGFGETDQYAHMGRYDMYLQQASKVDRMIADLWYFIQTNPHYRNKTTLIITTDHGRGRKTGTWYKHGILTQGSGETWFALMGPGISPEGEMKNVQQSYQKQIASTIAQLLGEDFDAPMNKAIAVKLAGTDIYQAALVGK